MKPTIESAATNTGRVLDAALKRVLTNDSIHFLRDADLVGEMHAALNQLVVFTGLPWREDSSDGR